MQAYAYIYLLFEGISQCAHALLNVFNAEIFNRCGMTKKRACIESKCFEVIQPGPIVVDQCSVYSTNVSDSKINN